MSKPIFVQKNFIVGAHSVVGDARRKYEDRARVEAVETKGGLSLVVAAVADGVGSADNGALGAQLVIDTVFEALLHSTSTELLPLMDQAIQQANRALYDVNNKEGKDGLTTLVLAVVCENRLYVANVGDSRAYWVQPSGKILQLTLDHTYGNLYGGSPDPREAARVVNILGRDPSVRVDFGFYLKGPDPNAAYQLGSRGLPLKPGESVLLCSDGLIKTDDKGRRYATDEEIVEALQSEFMPKRAAIKMVSIAEGRNPDDNISAVTIQYLTPEIIAQVEAQSAAAQRKALLFKIARALLVGALITAAIFLGYKWWKTQRQLADAQNQPTPTPDVRVVQITSTPEPTNTATQPIAPGQVRVHEINDGSEAYYRLSVMGEKERVEYGLLITPDMILSTEQKTGLRIVVGENVGAPSVVYLFPDGELSLSYTDAIHMTLTQGAVYIQAGSQEAEMLLPGYGDAKALVRNGRMIVQINGMDVTVFCFEGACRFSYHQGDDGFELVAGEQRVYNASSSSKGPKETIPYSLAWGWSLACHRCLDGVVATPTFVPPTLTFTQDSRPDRLTATPIPPTNTAVPSTNTPVPPTDTPKPTDTPRPTDTPKPTDTPTPTDVPTTPAPVCDPVSARDVTDSTAQGVAVNITLDGSGTNIRYEILSNPAHGGLGPLRGNKVKYTPDANFTGDDSFTYQVIDQCNQTDSATVTIHVGNIK